ncbi:MAG: coenzyme F420-0:L-glutamate ligase [Anaerolineae bacterium]
MNNATQVTLLALPGIPLIQNGDDLVRMILDALARTDMTLQDGDVLVIASKIVSKAEGRLVRLAEITPSARALELAEKTGKDARLVELVLQESVEVSRVAPGVLVTQHRLGFVSANAAIDQSNVQGSTEVALLLPRDPDASARTLHDQLHHHTGAQVGIVISDSHGRPFRMGNIGVALGVAGMPALLDLRGEHDLFGYELRISIQGYADLVASAAHLLTGEGREGKPVVLVRGLNFTEPHGTAHDLNRPREKDLYR